MTLPLQQAHKIPGIVAGFLKNTCCARNCALKEKKKLSSSLFSFFFFFLSFFFFLFWASPGSNCFRAAARHIFAVASYAAHHSGACVRPRLGLGPVMLGG